MKRSAAVVALSLVAGALAQIPTGLQASCNTFLTSLNTDPKINGCLSSFIDSTSDFDPTTNGAVTSPSSSAVQTALTSICGPSFDSKCPQATIRQTLADFYTACQTDMLGTAGDGSNGNKAVIAIYDVLYMITPLRGAICAKDGNEYCVNVIARENSNNSTTSGSSSAAAAPSGSDSAAAAPSGSDSSSAAASSSAPASSSPASSASSSAASASTSAHARRSLPVHPSMLYRRADNTTDQETLGTVAPEAARYNQLGLPYLFITSDFSTENLCTTCTAEVVGSYISFETITPYALGIPNSPMLSGQVKLWEKIKNCPNNFATNMLNNATGTTTSGALASVSFGFSQMAGAFAAALVGGVMLF